MQSFDDDPESGGSQDGSSDEEQERLDQPNEPEEAEAEAEAEDEGDGEGEGDGDDDDEEDGEAEEGEGEGQDEGSQQPADGAADDSAQPGGPAVTLTSPSPRPDTAAAATDDPRPPGGRIDVRPETLTAGSYDIVPTIAAPHSTSINTVAATPDLRWVFSGGSDGYIRRFNWVDTANGKLMLTVAQRHPFVDSVTKAGALLSYWENEEPQPRDESSLLSPVYSLAVHNQALWLLSGLESGGINLQSVRHEEGKRIACLRQHTSAVSALTLAPDERSVLSGSWDKTVLDWDLDTGQVKRSFIGSGGQISAMELRPLSSLPVPEMAPQPLPAAEVNGTFFSNNEDPSKPIGELGVGPDVLPNGLNDDDDDDGGGGVGDQGAGLSPVDSLFGGGGDDDDLFGESAADAAGGVDLGLHDDDNDNEFSRAIARDIADGEPAGGDVSMLDAGGDSDPAGGLADPAPAEPEAVPPASEPAMPAVALSGPLANGLPHAEDMEMADAGDGAGEQQEAGRPPAADSTFLAASIDGSIRVWDKRQPRPAAQLLPRNTPPWCMGACWSPDGNYIYAGRRNGTVEEYSLHRGLAAPDRVFRFPQGSGPVSAVRAMPNGRHLVCASHDILRLYDLRHQPTKGNTVPFLIVPGHRTGVVSQLFLDASCRFMISTAGTRGWEGVSTQVLLGYEVNVDG